MGAVDVFFPISMEPTAKTERFRVCWNSRRSLCRRRSPGIGCRHGQGRDEALAARGRPAGRRLLGHRAQAISKHSSVKSASDLPYPVFVKPANLGSSVGITKAHNAGELPAALALAAEFDRKIVVEKGIDAREIEISVLGNDEPKASVPGEIIPSREFYDYQAKYVDDDSRLLIPAPLERRAGPAGAGSGHPQRFRCWSARAWRASICFWKSPPGRFLVNEINTLPGFTSISMYPKLWEASGLPYSGSDRPPDRARDRAPRREEESFRTKVLNLPSAHNLRHSRRSSVFKHQQRVPQPLARTARGASRRSASCFRCRVPA